jgi:small subunit ribosomal protein S16
MGTKGRPYYRIVAAPSSAGRSGRFVELLGNYDPLKDPSLINMDKERMMHWLTNGASASDTLVRLLKREGVWTDFETTKPGKKTRRKPVKARVKREKPVKVKKKKEKPVEDAPAAEAVTETAAPEEAPVEA